MTVLNNLPVEEETITEPTQAEISLLGRLTGEHVVYLLIAAAAGILRLIGLKQIPLSPAEAAEALAVWQFWHPFSPTDPLFIPSSPAYFTLTNGLTQIAGDSELVLRFIPAAAGVALLAVPYFLRRHLGHLGALVTALFLAVSPLQVIVSRTVGGESLALLALGVVLLGWIKYRFTGEEKWLYTAAAGVGLGVTTAPLFYDGFIALVLASLVERYLGPNLFEYAEWPKTKEWQTAGVTAGGFALALGTFFMWNVAGVGATFSILSSWLGQLALPLDIVAWLTPILAMTRYETLALILALIIAAWMLWQSHPLGSYLSYWLMFCLLWVMIQSGSMDNSLLLTWPSYLLVGVFVSELFNPEKPRPDWVRWPLAGILLVLFWVIAIHLGRYARIASYNPDDVSYVYMAMVCAIMSILLFALMFTLDRRAALQGLVIPVLVMGVLVHWNSAWRMGYRAANDTREQWVVEATDTDIFLMLEQLEQIGRTYKGHPKAVTIYSGIDTPVLRWYLRHMPQVTFGAAVPSSSTADILLTPAEATLPEGSEYIGTQFGYYRPDSEHIISRAAALRWWFFYQSDIAIPEQKLTLWLNSQLLTNQP